MKKVVCTLFATLMFFVSTPIAYAYTYRVDIEDAAFSGDGEIVSFDVNENGEILICVEDIANNQAHIMIFNVQGELLHSLFIYKDGKSFLYSAFQGVQNIALFPHRGSKIYVIDRQGDALYEYSNRDINIALIGAKSEASYQNIQFVRNKKHSQIVKIQDGVEEIFYEVGVGNGYKTMSFFIVSQFQLCFIIVLFCVIVKRNRNKKDA